MGTSKYFFLVIFKFLFMHLQAIPLMIVNEASGYVIRQNLLIQITQTENGRTTSWDKVLVYGDNLQIEDINKVSALRISRYGEHQQQDEILPLKALALNIKAAVQINRVPKLTVKLSMLNNLDATVTTLPNEAELLMQIPDKVLDIFAKLDPASKEVDPYPDETLVTDKTKGFLAQVFPGLYHRGWSLSGSIPDSETLAAYILGIPTPIEKNNINGASDELIHKWIRTKNVLERSQVVQKALKLQAIQFILDTIVKARTILSAKLLTPIEEIIPVLRKLPRETFVAQLLTKAKDHLQTRLGGAELREALLSIIRGALVNYALVTNNQQLIGQFKVNCKDAIKNLIWYYYALAIGKNQAFEEGTFIVQDPTGAIFDLLRNCEGTKSRISTHFNEYLKESGLSPEERTQFGLDMRGLPTDKQTLLFSKLDPKNNLLFIKPESAGVHTFIDTVEHGISWARAQLRKAPGALQKKVLTFFEGQDAPIMSALTEYFKYYFGTDDDPSYRKERIPLDTLIEFGRLLYGLNRAGIINETDIAQTMKRASVLGIQYMYDISQRFIGQLGTQDPKLTKELQDFRRNLEQNYDHLQVRFGREVILLHDKELKSISLEQVQALAEALRA